MRIAVGLLAALSAGALTSALADPPTEAAPAATPAPVASSAAPASAAAPAAAASATAPTVDPIVQRLLSQGYRQQMRHGQVMYCKREAVLGSRLEKVERCGTVDELRSSVKSSQEFTEQTQRTQHNPSGH